MALSGLYWLLFATASPDYLLFLPGMILGGIGAGLTQAPLFASAATLSAHRATTGSAVLNMARQVGSAVGVAVLVALMASQHPDQLSRFDRGWALQFGAAAAAAAWCCWCRACCDRRWPAPERAPRGRRAGVTRAAALTAQRDASPSAHSHELTHARRDSRGVKLILGCYIVFLYECDRQRPRC